MPSSIARSEPGLLGHLGEEASVVSNSLIWRAVTTAGLSNSDPACWRRRSGRRAATRSVALSVPTERYCGVMLSTERRPRASIRISGSRCSHGRRKNASRMLSITRRVRPSGSRAGVRVQRRAHTRDGRCPERSSRPTCRHGRACYRLPFSYRVPVFAALQPDRALEQSADVAAGAAARRAPASIRPPDAGSDASGRA